MNRKKKILAITSGLLLGLILVAGFIFLKLQEERENSRIHNSIEFRNITVYSAVNGRMQRTGCQDQIVTEIVTRDSLKFKMELSVYKYKIIARVEPYIIYAEAEDSRVIKFVSADLGPIAGNALLFKPSDKVVIVLSTVSGCK